MNKWNEQTRLDIIDSIRPFLTLYLFKGQYNESKFINTYSFDLTNHELNALKTAHFLLSDEMNAFVDTLPILIRNLSHSTQNKKIESIGIIKGKIDWPDTYKQRYIQGFNDPTLFICNPSLKSYDLEENQLLKFLLKKIIELYDGLMFIKKPDELYYETSLKSDETIAKNDWQDLVNDRYMICKKTLKNVYFNEIRDLKIISPKIVQKAIKNRNSIYKIIVKLFELYEKLFIYEDFQSLEDLVQKQFLTPASDDTLYELYIFFRLVNYLYEIPEGNVKVGLLMEKNEYYPSNDKVKIYYQSTPKNVFENNSQYKEIFKYYSIGNQIRKPDILVEFKEDPKEYRIIEVKRTKDEKYIRDSVYKVLGYLNDFKTGIKFTDKLPSVITCWDGINITDKKAYDQEVLILNKNEFEKNIKILLSNKNVEYFINDIIK